MRDHGTRFECLRLRPHDHMGWVFAGSSGFAALAEPYLAEGAARGERLMYVAADPSPAALARLSEVVGRRALQVASTAEVYGASGVVDPPGQRATFAAALADARAEGYSGIRVAADNTPLVTDEVRLAGVPVTIRGTPAALGKLKASGLLASGRVMLQVAGPDQARAG